ncbi:MAG: sulfotransferase [Planctomycetes bacterium]|nr:sulfotransferase [Planctomycetota bacterium]
MIIATYRRLYAAFFEQVSRIPPGRYHELKYEDLVASPLSELESIYRALDLGEFETRRAALETYAAAKTTYRRNQFPEFSTKMRARLADEWRQSFDAWDYPR